MSVEARDAGNWHRPIVIGTGLLALDVVYAPGGEEPVGRWAGGTCGNVLTILSCLGWSSYPVARLADDAPARLIARDLTRWGVNQAFVSRESPGTTPVIVQRIRRDEDGRISHRFSFACPICGRRLPGFRPVPRARVEQLLPRMPTPAVFFFDRASRGAIAMAGEFASRGALVVFEPSSRKDPRLLEEAVAVAHVVKVSRERWGDCGEFEPRGSNLLLIETLGQEGLRFLSRSPGYASAGWIQVAGREAENSRDTAGAGDWCTAGIIASVGSGGLAGLADVDRDSLFNALDRGQRLAAWNCGFEGARGGLYFAGRERLRDLVTGLLPDPSFLRLQPTNVDVAEPPGRPEAAACPGDRCYAT
jgi:sugar/nucleoside kinase (ribokinase family)